MVKIGAIAIGLLLFGLMIFLHEFGHFFTAKLFHIQVNQFAIGMGPRLFHFQRGETDYSLRLLPIGGFCALEGEEEESDNPRAFTAQKAWKRAIVIVAGGIMNVLLGLILMFSLQSQEKEAFLSTRIVSCGEAVSTESGNFEPGDRIYAINGYRVLCQQDISYAMSRYNGDRMDFVVLRDGQKVSVSGVAIDFSRVSDAEQGYAFLVQAIPKNFGSTVSQSFQELISVSRMVYSSLFDLLTGHYQLKDMSGPVGMVEVIGEVADAGESFAEALSNVIWIMSLITVNLGLFNLLPVPALDGGRLFFILIEMIFRKPVPRKLEATIHLVGMALLLGLMAVITVSDVLKLIR